MNKYNYYNKVTYYLINNKQHISSSTTQKTILMIAGEMIYVLNSDTPNKAIRISDRFPGIPSNIDATLTLNKNIYFIKVLYYIQFNIYTSL